MRHPAPSAAACVTLACLLAACGQTGSLYLPDEGVTTPVEIRTAPQVQESAPQPTAAGAAEPAPGEPEKDDDVQSPTPNAGS
jgi:predicted small lipoprotein YifL